MFSFWTGRRFCNKIANHLGVRPALYSSALLECGTTWYHLKVLKQSGMSPEEAASKLMPTFVRGLAALHQKFGDQPEILAAHRKIEEWVAEAPDAPL